MKLRDILKDLQVLSASADMEREITGICYDSRLVKPGDLFVAVKGLTVDGHRFIPKAMELGETEGAMSSLSIAVSGLITVALASVFAGLI